MNEIEYQIELLKILNEHSEKTILKINKVLEVLPNGVQSIELQIFPDLDGEGPFGIQFSLIGRDLYHLNNLIKEYASLFNVKHASSGLTPAVPLMDPFDSKFEVNDVLVDTVSEWLSALCQKSNLNNFNIPVIIVTDEGYGKNMPKIIQ